MAGHENLSAAVFDRDLLQSLRRTQDGQRLGVEGIHKEMVSADLHKVLPHPAGPVGLQKCGNLLHGDVRQTSHSEGKKRIINIMLAVEIQMDLQCPLLAHCSKVGAVQLRANVLGIVIRPRVTLRAGDHSMRVGRLAQHIVIVIDNHHTVRLGIPLQAGFIIEDIFLGVIQIQMRLADIGQHHDVRSEELRRALHITRLHAAHLLYPVFIGRIHLLDIAQNSAMAVGHGVMREGAVRIFHYGIN